MPFRFHAKTLFATYPQSDQLTHERLIRFFEEEKGCAQYTIGKESHENGGTHYHCLILWNEPVNTTNERYFDIDGYHPNIQPGRNQKAIYAYVTKDGDYRSNRPEGEEARNKWTELLECQDAETFWETAKRKCPADFILRHDKLEYFADKHFKRTISEYISPYTDFVVTPEIQKWLTEEFPKVIELWGPCPQTPASGRFPLTRALLPQYI